MDPVDGIRVERTDGGEVDRQAAAELHGVGPAVLELLVVEEGVGPGGDDLVGEHRRLGRVDAVDPHLSRLDPLEEGVEAIDVERLVERVADGLAHEHVVGDLAGAHDVVLAGRGLGEDGGQQVVGLHALDRRRVAPTAPEAQDHQRSVEVPAPPGLEHRRVEDGVLEGVVDRAAGHVADHLVEREAVVRAEREDDRVVGGGGLQLEVEGATELLAQRQAQATVDAPAVGRVDDELHATGVVEEPLQHQAFLGRHRPEGGPADGQVVDDHRGGGQVDAGRLHDPAARPVGIAGRQALVDLGPEARHLDRQLVGAGRRLAQPEGDGGWGVTGVTHPDDAGLDPPDLPRVGTQEEDVTRHRLDRPVLVDRADEGVVWVRDDAIVAGLGNGAPRGRGGEAGALAGPELAVDGVVVDVGAAAPPSGLDAAAHQLDDLVELGPGEVVVGRSPADEGVQVVGPPLGRGHLGHHLLGQDVERPSGRVDGIEAAGADGQEQRGALHQLVAGEREQPPLGRPRAGVVGAAHPLQEGGDAAGRSDLADQVDRADVDPELQGGGGDERLEVTGPEAGLDPVAALLREAPVVGRHRLLTQALAQLVGQPLGQAAGVDEHQRGAVLHDQLGDAVEHVAHLLGRGHGLELAVGQLEGDVERPLVTDVDDRRQWPVADQEAADRLDRALGGGQTDPYRATVTHPLEPLEGEGQVRASLVAGHGVDLVDDHRLDRAQRLAPLLTGDQEVERLGRGHHEAGRTTQHRGPLRDQVGRRRCAPSR